MKKTIGMWMYSNGGGDKIQEKIISQLTQRGIRTINNLNLRNAFAREGKIFCDDAVMEYLDLYFSFNAGAQSPYQVYLYEVLNYSVPIINSFKSFHITQDRFKVSKVLHDSGVSTTKSVLCHVGEVEVMRDLLHKWKRMVFKPVAGWGGLGTMMIDDESSFDMLIPFLKQIDLNFFYVEKYIDYDYSDYRVNVVDGKVISCYGRKAPKNDWKVSAANGSKIISRDLCDEVEALALKAVNAIGLDIAGVNLLYDLKKEKYVVLEVNSIPAFATPEQEKLGLDFNDKMVDAIVELIEKRVK